MSHVHKIQCDAPHCTTVKQSTNNWFVLRESTDNILRIQPMHDHVEALGDQHICSSKCVHALVEAYIQEHTLKPVIAGPRCTCRDTYEVGSGTRCPVHEITEVGVNHKGDAVWPYAGAR